MLFCANGWLPDLVVGILCQVLFYVHIGVYEGGYEQLRFSISKPYSLQFEYKGLSKAFYVKCIPYDRLRWMNVYQFSHHNSTILRVRV